MRGAAALDQHQYLGAEECVRLGKGAGEKKKEEEEIRMEGRSRGRRDGGRGEW